MNQSFYYVWYWLDIFTPQNKVLGCRMEGWISWESTFSFTWVDNNTFSMDEEYRIYFVNTPSVEKLRKIIFFFMKISLKTIIFAVRFLGSSSRFLEFQVLHKYNGYIWTNLNEQTDTFWLIPLKPRRGRPHW